MVDNRLLVSIHKPVNSGGDAQATGIYALKLPMTGTPQDAGGVALPTGSAVFYVWKTDCETEPRLGGKLTEDATGKTYRIVDVAETTGQARWDVAAVPEAGQTT